MLSGKENWNHVPGVLNPADLPSRGCSVKHLLQFRWWEGPAWLRDAKEFWPKSEIAPNEEILNSERKKTVASNLVMSAGEKLSGVLMNTRRECNFQKLVKILGWMFRFKENCRRKRNERIDGPLSVQEMETAEKKLVFLSKIESFAGTPDLLKGIRTYHDEEGVLRVKTKIVRRDDSQNFKCPAVLPPDHPLVNLIVTDCHRKLCHAGVQLLLCSLRERFWILRGRKTVRRIIRECFKCKRFDVSNIELDPAPLPLDRVREAAVFEVAGVDLAGPLFLKGGRKSWIVLFTCAVYRAVHLELVTCLSTDAFLQALRRFISRRGRPNIIYSDNGTNFTGAVNLFRGIDWSAVDSYSSARRIQWRFNAPTASWWGGWFERLVQTTKKILRRVLGRAALNFEELLTVLCDAEAVINSRPLTYVTEDSEDLMPLTPAMFLQEVTEVGVPDLDEIDGKALNRRLAYRQRLREDLRKRFRQEYLGMLLQPGKKTKKSNPVAVGDVVLVGADGTKRIDWIMAKVLEVFPGSDGVVRVVRLKTSKGEISRPVQRLYPLEISHIEREDLLPSVFDTENEPNKIVTRSGRIVKPPTRL